MTWDVSRFCGPPLELCNEDIFEAVIAAAKMEPIAGAERFTNLTPDLLGNRFDSIAIQSAILRSRPDVES